MRTLSPNVLNVSFLIFEFRQKNHSMLLRNIFVILNHGKESVIDIASHVRRIPAKDTLIKITLLQSLSVRQSEI